MSRRRLIADGWANVRFRLQGATDQTTHALRDRISDSLTGTRVRDLQRLGPDVLARILPRIYPRMLALAYEHQDAGRRVYIFTAASQELAEMLAHVLTFDGGIGSQFSAAKDGVYTGEPTGLFIYGCRQSARHQAPRRTRGDRPESSPTRTRIRRPTCRCCELSATRSRQPGHGAAG